MRNQNTALSNASIDGSADNNFNIFDTDRVVAWDESGAGRGFDRGQVVAGGVGLMFAGALLWEAAKLTYDYFKTEE